MKILVTTLGETLGDFISMTLNLGYSNGILITLLFFLIILTIQLFQRKYIPIIYWLVIIGTTTLGTEISDFIDRTLHFGYALGTLLLVNCLFFTLSLWYKKYKNLEVYPIADKHKEIYYWVTILFSNSLGTAFGDFLSDNIGLSYLTGAMVTGMVIIVVVLLHYYSKLNHIALFWIAFIFTRPFGATLGDFLTKPHSKGGLDLGTSIASIISVIIMFILIFISSKQDKRKLEKQ